MADYGFQYDVFLRHAGGERPAGPRSVRFESRQGRLQHALHAPRGLEANFALSEGPPSEHAS